MHDDGLHPAADPSATAAGGWTGGVPGTIAFPMVEGRRSLIVEVQALVAETRSSQPRRSVKGIDAARIHQILAVLDRHVGLGFGSLDVYVGVVGGIRVREPAADLPVAVALASSVLNRPAGRTAAWGEVGLTGEIRPVSLAERRRKEAERFGLGVLAPGPGAGHLRDALASLGLRSADGARRFAAAGRTS